MFKPSLLIDFYCSVAIWYFLYSTEENIRGVWGKRDEIRHLGRPRCKWVANIKTYLKIRGDCICWIHLAQDMVKWWGLVSMVMNLLVV
jgi:hypothetical protein